MDITPEYVKMCQKAEEIQDQKPVDDIEGEFVALPGDSEGFQAAEVNQDSGHFYRSQLTWLPRQDQLQEMIKGRYAIDRLVELLSWATTSGDGGLNWRPAIGGWSMEQLWLGVVMDTTFGKVWDGETWQSLKTATPS